MIQQKHRNLARHAGDLDAGFLRRIAKLPVAKRKIALEAKIRALGWSFRRWPRSFTRDFWLRNMALHKVVVLGIGWEEKSLYEQCRTLAHELVHIRQRLRLGRAKFLARYAIAEWRWAMEVSAYRSNWMTLPKPLRPFAEWLKRYYLLGRLRKVYKETRAVLQEIDIAPSR